MSTVRKAALALACALTILPSSVCAATARTAGGVSGVSGVIYPLMERYGIPGMAVGLVIDGHPYVYNYGVASKATNAPVTGDTLFEIGSVSKTFTATLASFAQVSGKLSLSDSVDAYLPSLRGSAFGRVTLLNLGTHTPGGLPLQVPDRVTNDAQLMAYLRRWKPAHAPGTYRTYSNIGIGLLGVIAAQSMSEPFDALMQSMLFPALGMKHSFIRMPSAQMKNYAQGYTESDAPIRMPAGVLGDEAYGIRTTAGDMVRFLRANMDLLVLDPKLQRAVDATHTGYFRAGAMTQDLIWEQLAYPVGLGRLLAANSATMLFDAVPASRLEPPLPPQGYVLLNKTGSTNGFSAYVLFVPAKKFGIVLLANKSYPIRARVTAAYQILAKLRHATGNGR